MSVEMHVRLKWSGGIPFHLETRFGGIYIHLEIEMAAKPVETNTCSATEPLTSPHYFLGLAVSSK
jgi:hypothetical protein